MAILGNQPAEAYYVRQHIVKHFLPIIIANLFSSWDQANRYINKGYSLGESLFMTCGYTIGDLTTITHPPFSDGHYNLNDDQYLQYEYF